MAAYTQKVNKTVAERLMRLFFVTVVVLAPCLVRPQNITIDVTDRPLSEVFQAIKKASGYQVFYVNQNVDDSRKVSLKVSGVDLRTVLDKLCASAGLSYNIVDRTIVITPPRQKNAAASDRRPAGFVITGTVFDENKNPVAYASVVQKDAGHNGVSTDEKGCFRLTLPSGRTSVVVSCMGMKKQTIEVNNQSTFDIYLEPEVNDIAATVVTGYMPKAKNSFTGTAVLVKGDELRTVNNNSFFDALKVFDPSFQVVDVRGMFGSDPNYIPEQIEIRGQNSFPEISGSTLKTMTSLPIFILDGFEVKVQQVYDLDMNRIQSVTILKDASASAIYGSRAANGVIVIETKSPEPGALRVSYTLTGGVNIPDLSSYKLMNASQALEFQRLSGLFNPAREGEDGGYYLNSYNLIRKEILAGVDTYWLSKPLRVGLQHRHSVIIEGSVNRLRANQGNVRYQVNLSLGQNNGVMKESGRTTYGAGTKLIYSHSSLRITNDLQFSISRSDESPYGSFSSYSKTLPYHREKDADGAYYRTLSLYNVAPEGMELAVSSSQLSPVYEAKYLSSFTHGDVTNVTNNTAIDWTIVSGLKVRGDFSVSSDFNRTDIYLSPMSYSYIRDNDNDVNDPSVLYARGKYTLNNGTDMTLAGKLMLSYTKQLDRHLVQAVVGGDLREVKRESDGYVVTGFMDDALDYVSYAVQYEPDSRPSGNESIVRSAGAYLNANYSYDDRYLVDLTGRIDGSSIYGSKQQTAPYWSAGVRWNLHNERFMKGWGVFSLLALRANIGTTGNQNFTQNQSKSMYTYLKPVYGNLFGTSVSVLGNPDLECQKTFNRNVGLELTVLKGLLNLDMNYYYNTTEGSLTSVTIAPSIGFSELKVNQGDIVNKGIDFSLSVTPVRTKEMLFSVTFNGRHNSNILSKISNTLKNYNKMVGERAESSSDANVFLFKEGESLNTIYGVRSFGINPGTGREEFLTKDGERTDVWKYEDMVPIGVGEAALEGYTGFNFRYKELEVGASFNYSFGADRYNFTLHEKIEGADPSVNNDVRALTERWKEPGQIARYKAIDDTTPTRSTSRFVQRENRLSLSSLRVAYTFPVERWGWKGISMLRLQLTANELFYLSTIRQERGLAYPYARTISFSAQVNF